VSAQNLVSFADGESSFSGHDFVCSPDVMQQDALSKADALAAR
jgi:hypothetical protein